MTMDQPPHESWCVIAKRKNGKLHTDHIPESCAGIAIKHGWDVVICDSDIPPQDIEPSQSNPRRTE